MILSHGYNVQVAMRKCLINEQEDDWSFVKNTKTIIKNFRIDLFSQMKGNLTILEVMVKIRRKLYSELCQCLCHQSNMKKVQCWYGVA